MSYANILRRALYKDARAGALKELYKSKELDRTRSPSIEADFEEVAASCGQFSFSLYDFGSEMQNLLSILEELKEQTEQTKNRSWKWLRFWQHFAHYQRFSAAPDPEQEPLIARTERPSTPKNVAELAIETRNLKHLNTELKEKNANGGFSSKIFHALRFLERDNG